MLSPTTRSIKFTICDIFCIDTEAKKPVVIPAEFIGWYYSSKQLNKQIGKQSLIKAPLEIHHITNIRRVMKHYSMSANDFLKYSILKEKTK